MSSRGERIVFRNAFETDAHSHYLDTRGESVSVAEAKVLMAKELGLEKEFARRFDLKLLRILPDKSQVELTDDAELITPGTQLIVQRTLWRPLEDVKQEAKSFIQEWKRGTETVESFADQDTTKSEPKEPLPARYICAVCEGLLRQAMAVRCHSGCNVSVCKECAESLLAPGRAADCPSCGKPVKNFINNKILNGIIAKLSFSNFILPERKVVQAEQPPAAVEPVIEQIASFMMFVSPAQIQFVHSRCALLIPQACAVVTEEFKTTGRTTSLFVFALGGGGTSLLSPGILKIESVTDLPSDDISDEHQELRRAWFGKVDNEAYILIRCTWELHFESPVLLPGKAQPIAGIWSSVKRISSNFECAKLTPLHHQGIAQRLSQEALYSRANNHHRPAQPKPAAEQPPPVAPTGFVFDPVANAWTGQQVDHMKKFVSLQPRESPMHWQNINPMLPYVGLLPKLSLAAFQAVQKLQEVALHTLCARNRAKSELLQGFRELKGNVFQPRIVEVPPPQSFAPVRRVRPQPREPPPPQRVKVWQQPAIWQQPAVIEPPRRPDFRPEWYAPQQPPERRPPPEQLPPVTVTERPESFYSSRIKDAGGGFYSGIGNHLDEPRVVVRQHEEQRSSYTDTRRYSRRHQKTDPPPMSEPDWYEDNERKRARQQRFGTAPERRRDDNASAASSSRTVRVGHSPVKGHSPGHSSPDWKRRGDSSQRAAARLFTASLPQDHSSSSSKRRKRSLSPKRSRPPPKPSEQPSNKRPKNSLYT